VRLFPAPVSRASTISSPLGASRWSRTGTAPARLGYGAPDRSTLNRPTEASVTGVGRNCGTPKLLVDGFSTKIARSHQELRVLVYPSSIDLSSRTLRYLTGRLAARRGEIGTRWRRLTAGRQALLALAHLRCGDTYTQLAAGYRHRDRIPLHTRGRGRTGRPRAHPGRGDAPRTDQGVRDPGRHPAAYRQDRRRHPVLLGQTQAPRHERPSPHRPVRPPVVGLARACPAPPTT
jgi:hypothetical protein